MRRRHLVAGIEGAQGVGRSALGGETPGPLLTEIALAREAEPALGISGIHFFTFGSMAQTAQWVESVRG